MYLASSLTSSATTAAGAATGAATACGAASCTVPATGVWTWITCGASLINLPFLCGGVLIVILKSLSSISTSLTPDLATNLIYSCISDGFIIFNFYKL